MKELGQDPEIVLLEEEWEFLEQAGGVPLEALSRQEIEDALARWVRSRTRELDPDDARLPNRDVRRELEKMQTRNSGVLKSLERLAGMDAPILGAISDNLLLQGATWRKPCCDCPKPCFRLPGNVYWHEVLNYLRAVRDALGTPPAPAPSLKPGAPYKRVLKQALDHAVSLVEALTPSDGGTQLGATPTGAGVLVRGAGLDASRDAAIHAAWYHLRRIIQWKHIGSRDVITLLECLKEALSLSVEEVKGGRRTNQYDWVRASVIAQCGLAYAHSAGKIRLYYDGEDRQRSSEFILLIFELDGFLCERGHPPLADTEKGIAEAARKLYRKAAIDDAKIRK